MLIDIRDEDEVELEVLDVCELRHIDETDDLENAVV